jgi:hypothetical protein
MSWTAWWRHRRIRCPEQPESRRRWRRPWGLPVWWWTTWWSRSRPRPSGGCGGACRTQRHMRPRKTASRDRTDSRQASSRRQWATPTGAPPASGVCSGFPSKKHGFIFGVDLWKWLTSQIHEKNITENKCHTCKKKLSWKHYSNKINCMQGSSLNTTPPSKNIIQESRWYLSTTTHCARLADGLRERCSNVFTVIDVDINIHVV